MMLQTRHIRYFIAVAEELNFHRAAERVHISQPALWRQIRDLEHTVGVKLLDRMPRGISLTPAGEAFLEECGDLLARIESACMRARRVAQGQVGTLHVAFNEIAARRRELPRILKAFRSTYPEINLQLHVMMSQQQIGALRAEDIDAGFLFRHDGELADLQNLRIGQDNFVLALPRDNQLARRPTLRLADLADQPLIMPNPRYNGATHERLLGAFRAAGLIPQIAQYADNESTLLNLVTAGMGLAFLNSSFPRSDARGAVLRPLADLSLPVDLDLVWRRDNPNPALKQFISLVDRLSGDEDQVALLLETGMG
jgi:DNA-binding transcriptional LysR family regulator